MDGPQQLAAIQVELAEVFFGLDEAAGFHVAGGAALVASDLITRPTEDLDLFTAAPTTSVTAAKDAFVQHLTRRGFDVATVHDGFTFCRLVVTRDGEETLIDLAIDSPPRSRPVLTVLGPTLSPLELAGRKLLALFGRAEARDFADVYVLAQRFGKDALTEQAWDLEAGFDLVVLAQMMRTIDRFVDDEIPLAPESLPTARAFFADWASQVS